MTEDKLHNPPPGDSDDAGDAADATDLGDFDRYRRQAVEVSSEPTAASPERIGRYRILEVLGEGGMGTVFLAEQTEPIHRRVAVKLIRASRLDRHTTHRFEAERRALARMSHPAIAQVYEAGDTEAGQPFFAMELVPGERITDYCDRERLTIDERLRLFCEVCSGIQHAHQKGILHRDIKPANILVIKEQGRPVPKIIDFGIAKALDGGGDGGGLTEHGVVVGTPSYLSPESIAGEGADPDTRTDVFSLGVLLFELLVGDRPFGKPGDSLLKILREIGEGELPAPTARWRALDEATQGEHAAERATTPAALARRLRGDLDAIVLKATARARARRYDSAAELAADIERHLAFAPIAARPPSPLYALAKLARRHRAAMVGGALVFLALVGGIVARSLEAHRANLEAAAARQAETEAEQVVDFLVELFEVNDPGTTRGETVTARELLDRGAERIRTSLGDQPLTRARLLDTIGVVYRQLDLPEPARPLLEEALTLRERALGEDHPEVATSLDHLGEVYWLDGDYPAAEATLRRALATRERAFGPDHLLVAEVLDHLGSACEIQAKYDEAQPMLERALAIRERQLGPDHLEVAASLDDLGICRLDQGDGAGAEPLLRRALAIREQVLGADHPEVAVSANGLAGALYRQGRLEESMAQHQRALDIREQVYGPEGAPVAQSLNNLANIFLDLHREGEAEAALLRARTIWQKVLGGEHARIGIVDFNLADLYRERGELARAEALYRATSEIWEKAYGPRHPRVAMAYEAHAKALHDLGRDAEAIPLCRQVLALRESLAGSEPAEVAKLREQCEAWGVAPAGAG